MNISGSLLHCWQFWRESATFLSLGMHRHKTTTNVLKLVYWLDFNFKLYVVQGADVCRNKASHISIYVVSQNEGKRSFLLTTRHDLWNSFNLKQCCTNSGNRIYLWNLVEAICCKARDRYWKELTRTEN